MLLLTLLIGTADAGVCAEDYTGDDFLDDMTTAQSALRSGDDYSFINAVTSLQGGLDCLSEALPPRVLASAYRMIGAQIVLEGDTADGQRWFRTALELDPTFRWDISEFSQEGTDALVRDAWNAELGTSHEQQTLSGVGLSAGGGRLLLDGREIRAPQAALARYHLLQLLGEGGAVEQAWVIEGNDFPDEVLGSDSSAAPVADRGADEEPEEGRRERTQREPRERRQKDAIGSAGVISVERNRPPLKIPAMVVGGLGLAAGGGLYAMSFGAAGDFESATTEAALLDARSRANTLVLASAALTAAGAGLGTWGVLMDGGPALGLTWTW